MERFIDRKSRQYVDLETGRKTKDKQLQCTTQRQGLTGTERQRLVGR